MKRKRTRPKQSRSAAKPTPLPATCLKPVGQLVVTPKQALEKLPGDKHIHPRRPMRLIPDKAPEGKETDQNQSPGPEANQSDLNSERGGEKDN